MCNKIDFAQTELFFLHFTHQVSLALTGSTTQPVETALYCQLVCVRTTTNLDAVVMPGLSLGHKNTEFLSIIFSIWLYTDIRISFKKASLFIKCHHTSYLFDLVDFYTKRPFMIPQRDFFPAKTEPASFSFRWICKPLHYEANKMAVGQRWILEECPF